jgi:hypothetical protein
MQDPNTFITSEDQLQRRSVALELFAALFPPALTAALLLPLLLATNAHAAAEFDDHTSCAAVNTVLDVKEPDMDQLQNFKLYALNTMDGLDEAHTENGEPGIMSQLSDDGANGMVAAAVMWCRDHPKESAYNAVAFVYNGIRDMEMAVGAAK